MFSNLLRMKTIKSFFTILASLFLLPGCKTIINEMAFHPDTRNVIPANKLPQNIKELSIETEDSLRIHSYFIPNTASGKVLRINRRSSMSSFANAA